METVKSFAEVVEEYRQTFTVTNLKVTSTLAVLPSLMELVGGAAVVFLVWYGSRQVAANELTEGDFLLFVAAAFMMYTPIKKLSRVNANLQQVVARWSEAAELSVYLADDIAPEALARVDESIKSSGMMERYAFVSKEEALRRYEVGMAAYKRREWAAAKAEFEAALGVEHPRQLLLEPFEPKSAAHHRCRIHRHVAIMRWSG